jgi:hypothetical protein
MGPRGLSAKLKHGLVDWHIAGCGLPCSYCAREMIPHSDSHPTRDHVYPRSKGGTRTVWACGTCNQMKADMLPDDWRDFMYENPRWWAAKPSLAWVKPCPVMTMVAQFFIELRYPHLYKTRNGVSR